LVYTLNVEVFPDTKELTFKNFCDACDKKAEASRTPEDRATGQRLTATGDAMIRNMEAAPGIGGLVKRCDGSCAARTGQRGSSASCGARTGDARELERYAGV